MAGDPSHSDHMTPTHDVEQDVGTISDDAVHAHLDELFHLAGIVDRPHLHQLASPVRGPNERRCDEVDLTRSCLDTPRHLVDDPEWRVCRGWVRHEDITPTGPTAVATG